MKDPHHRRLFLSRPHSDLAPLEWVGSCVAAKTLAAFGATLRQEVDLEQLCEQLLTVVHRTMQPAHISLWMHPSEQANDKQATGSSPPPIPKDGEGP